MTPLSKEPESQVRIRFPDCDAFNHLHNARYLDYLINAREDQLLACYGFDPYALAREQGIGWVAAQTQIAYLAPAVLMELVTVQTRLLAATERSLLVEALMWNDDKTQLKAVMWTRLVHYHLRERRSWPHAPALMDFLRSIEAPLPDEPSFEARVAQVRPLKPATA